MEKIIYNKKLKKIFVSILLIILLFNFITPTIVRAEDIDDSYWDDITWITPKEEWKTIYLDDMTDKLYKESKFSENDMSGLGGILAGGKADEKVPGGRDSVLFRTKSGMGLLAKCVLFSIL